MTQEEMADLIRLVMGSLPLSILPEAIVTHYLVSYSNLYQTDCEVLYHSIVSLYNWLISKAEMESSGGGERTEVNGKRRITINEYNKANDWKNGLNDFLANPSRYIPECADMFIEMEKDSYGRVVIGGVREDNIKSVNSNSNIRTGGASEIGGVARTPYDGLVSRNGFVITRSK